MSISGVSSSNSIYSRSVSTQAEKTSNSSSKQINNVDLKKSNVMMVLLQLALAVGEMIEDGIRLQADQMNAAKSDTALVQDAAKAFQDLADILKDNPDVSLLDLLKDPANQGKLERFVHLLQASTPSFDPLTTDAADLETALSAAVAATNRAGSAAGSSSNLIVIDKLIDSNGNITIDTAKANTLVGSLGAFVTSQNAPQQASLQQIQAAAQQLQAMFTIAANSVSTNKEIVQAIYR